MENKDTLDTIMRLARVTRRNHPGRSRGHHFSRSISRSLMILQEEGTMRASELAERLDIRPASLTEQLTKMEAHGLIQREKDPADRRAILVTLTKSGKARLDKDRAERQAWNKKLEAAMTEEELGNFAQLAEKLIAFFEAQSPPEKNHRRSGDTPHDRPKGRKGPRS